MKKVLVIVMVIGCMLQLQLASAQSAEVQQLVLNVEKLAQLKQILSDMKKGYQVLNNGYGTIRNVTEGNFKIHDVFLKGLLSVNPELRKYRKVADIIQYQARILSEYKSAFNHFKEGGRFTPDEMIYLSKVYGNLFDRSLENLDELAMILTASELRMSDDERLKAIDRLYVDMQGKLSFLRSFNRKTASLDRGRQKQQQENAAIKKLYGLQ
jgi:hypothetical protein